MLGPGSSGLTHDQLRGWIDAIWGTPIDGGMYDFRPGDPTRSYALARMSVRAEDRQMPLIGSNRVDATGTRIIEAWIEQMTPARGYPEASP